MAVRRIHVTGGPGSGKTRLAQRLAATLGVPFVDLDGMTVALDGRIAHPVAAALFADQMQAAIEPVLRQDAWVSDGAYLGWALPFFEAADVIVWMQTSWRVASYRILLRHVRADLARNNRFPGYRQLLSFWRWCGDYYANRNPEGLNVCGTPNSIATLTDALHAYADKVVPCRSNRDTDALLQRLTPVAAVR
jgi:adenylate kinase family enzyme